MKKEIHLKINPRDIRKPPRIVIVERHLSSTRGWRFALRENSPTLVESSRTLGAAPILTTGEAENELCVSSGPMTQARVDVQGELLLRPAKSLFGLQVVTEDADFRMGVVRDLMFNPETEQAVALVLGVKEFFGMRSFQIVPWHEIVLIGEDKITVKNANSKVKLSDYPPTSFLKIDHDSIDHETTLSGTEIIDGEGRVLGTFADIYIDESSGSIQGIEVSGEFVAISLQGLEMRGKKTPPVSSQESLKPLTKNRLNTNERNINIKESFRVS